jgi:sugar transferase (PEP-CTERM/EpsH1 system associated)
MRRSSAEGTVGPVRVMHLLLKFGFGGSEGGVLKLANGFDRARVLPSICSALPADTIKQRLAADVPLFEVGRRSGNDLGFVFRLYRLLRRERPHVLHTHGWATLCEGLVAARLARVPIVVHGEHGTLDTRPRNLLLQRIVWGRVDQVLSVSTRLADKMARTVGFPLEKIHTIRNGVDLDRFTPALRTGARAELEARPGAIRIVIVGRLLPVKDHRTFLGSVRLLRDGGVDVAAFIVGDGPLAQDLRSQVAALGLESAVTFLGNRVDVQRVLAGCDIAVSSSTSEGLSNTVLEAMATGIPVVATDVGGTGELVVHGETGLLVPPGSPADLAGALATLAQDAARRSALGAAGRLRAEAEFSSPGMVEKYEELYLSLAARRQLVPVHPRARVSVT